MGEYTALDDFMLAGQCLGLGVAVDVLLLVVAPLVELEHLGELVDALRERFFLINFLFALLRDGLTF